MYISCYNPEWNQSGPEILMAQRNRSEPNGKEVKWIIHSDKLSEKIPTLKLWFLGDRWDELNEFG